MEAAGAGMGRDGSGLRHAHAVTMPNSTGAPVEARLGPTADRTGSGFNKIFAKILLKIEPHFLSSDCETIFHIGSICESMNKRQ